jgi:hypothetical protein
MRDQARHLLAGDKALLCAALLLSLSSGCIKKEPPPEAPARVIADAPSLLAGVRERTSSLSRLDASIEVRLSGATAVWRGRFYGTLQMERSGGDRLALLLQVYSLIGAPVLEVTSVGDRIEVYSPLDRTLFFNFTELVSGESVDEFPLSSFSEIAIPLDMLKSQAELLWGLGFSESYQYEFTDTGESYLLTEWSEGSLLREMEYTKPGLYLRQVKVYRGGVLAGGMECGSHGSQGGGADFIPRRMDIFSDGARAVFKLSRVRSNSEVTGPEVSFKIPPHDRLILLTPPAP